MERVKNSFEAVACQSLLVRRAYPEKEDARKQSSRLVCLLSSYTLYFSSELLWQKKERKKEDEQNRTFCVLFSRTR